MINELIELQNKGYLKSVKHRELPLYVWDYTPVVQFERLFGDYPLLRNCRGLVTDDQGNIVSNCLKKFFNYEELNVSERPYKLDKIEVTDKLDGSYFAVSRYNGQLIFNTRGSFYSNQCLLAQNLFYEIYNPDWIEDGITYLFEYIGPTNRIVVTYPEPDLIHIARLDTKTGADLERDSRFKCVQVFEINDGLYGEGLYELLTSLEHKNKEGFVIRQVLNQGVQDFRMKIKFQSYKELHRIVTGVSSKNIWEMLSGGKDFNAILDICPDEFNDWVRGVKAKLELEYLDVESRAKYALDCVKDLPTRKEQAMKLISEHKAVAKIVFLMLDGADYSFAVWKMIEPKFEQPFLDQALKPG